MNKIKNKVKENVGIKHKFIFNGSRNQIEEFVGYIDSLYSNVFTIKTDDSSIKSFSYNDVLIHKLVFKSDKT